MTEQKTAFDFEEMRRAIEDLDAEALVALYAENAEMTTVSKSSTPSSPKMRRGKEEISEFLRDVCGQAMTHRVENEVVGEGRVAFNEACEYADGTKVLAAVTVEIEDGKIVRQAQVEAWDE